VQGDDDAGFRGCLCVALLLDRLGPKRGNDKGQSGTVLRQCRRVRELELVQSQLKSPPNILGNT
jgi:hypothetical protein